VWLLCGAGLLAVGIMLVLLRWHRPPPAPTQAADPFPLPVLSPSPFLNTGPEARYVGSAACGSCHPEREASFRRTGMGRSMARVDVAREPPDAAFDHPGSKRRYQVRRQDGKLWHRELLLGGGAEEVVLEEHPLLYVVGSGRHSLTYLVEADGFLVESPVTWYTSRKAWAMSPGYDVPQQQGFARAAGESCLVCHAGQSEALDRSAHRMHVGEAAIGCERCHGPGSLHAERHRDAERPARRVGQQPDYTIVNPSRLSRQLAEAICQQCHLRPTAVVVARGRKLADFRPGLPLEDFRHSYMLEGADSAMTVTGHVEQMHLSRCYQKSAKLTCLTCHDPHGEPGPVQRLAHYQAACLGCHAQQGCTVSAERRARESPENDCVRCHMPRSPTEIPHLAFTHHRIALHGSDARAKGEPEQPAAVELRPFLDLSRLGEVDRQRSLGLAYMEAAEREKLPERAMLFRSRALELLSQARAAGLREGLLDVGLARLCADTGQGDVGALAESALGHADLAGQERCNALFLLADEHVRGQRWEEAAVALRELVSLRRHERDWELLGLCEGRLGNPAAAERALTMAVRINPRLWEVHQRLAEHQRRQGNAKQAAWHQRRAVP
jgi:predicted CXXCH cytochrome family protein